VGAVGAVGQEDSSMLEVPSTTTPRVVFRYENTTAGRVWLSLAGDTFARVVATSCGQVLLEAIETSGGRRVIIRPRTPAELAQDTCNAYARPVSTLDATRGGETLLSCTDSRPVVGRSVLDRVFDMPGRTYTGTGTGSDSELAFESAIWHSGAVCGALGAGAADDEILMHEMVHAVRQLRGLMHCAPMYGDYDTQEEFFALVVANIYIACKTPAPGDTSLLRSNHHGFGPITGSAAGWLDSHRRNRVYLGQMRREMSDFWGNLSRIPVGQCWFNPVRQVEFPPAAGSGATGAAGIRTTASVTAGPVQFDGEPQG